MLALSGGLVGGREKSATSRGSVVQVELSTGFFSSAGSVILITVAAPEDLSLIAS